MADIDGNEFVVRGNGQIGPGNELKTGNLGVPNAIPGAPAVSE